MRNGSWMLAQLDYATHGHHMHADAPRMALLVGHITQERYEEYLSRVYMFEAPVELFWLRTEGMDQLIDLRPRLRTGFLITDLRALGARVPTLENAPSFVGIEQALGWMYVVERGRRMNGLLYRHLLRRIPEAITIAGNYLNASSPCGQRWQQLGATLDRLADNHAAVEQIVNAANRAFRTLRQAQPSAGSAHAA